VDAVWVTVSPLGSSAGVVVHVRPGQRQPSGPAAAAEPAPHLRVYTLGRSRVDTADGPLDGDWLLQRPGQLFKLLVAERHRVVPVEDVAETLWPDRGLQAVANVRHFIHALRRKLEPDRERGSASFIVGCRGGYTIDRARVRVDADEFEHRVHFGLAAVSSGDDGAATEALDDALKMYRGDFLEEEHYSEWAFAERDRLRQVARRALDALDAVKRRGDDMEGAAEALERLATLEPFDTDVQRRLLAMCLKRGRRSEAIRRYSALRAQMLRHFGEVPDFTLADLVPSVSTDGGGK
jgi:DNA-binding SARP family transcriptional activator